MEKGKTVTIAPDVHKQITDHINPAMEKIGGFVAAAIVEKIQRDVTREMPTLERNQIPPA